ncbi:MAG TPA: NUDIX domain-containing protein [Patescibacteria group bacterium]|nr:NUDIX domain-containing protein [Patescibacteria group bacterium]
MKKCDHKSVGILVWKNEKLLLIERARFPFGFAPPAGHVDADTTFESAAKRELAEETGLIATSLQVVAMGKKENVCRRTDDKYHEWKIYCVETEGSLKTDPAEVKQVNWLSLAGIRELAALTNRYLKGEISETEWEKRPGIEPVWYDWFKELDILK